MRLIAPSLISEESCERSKT